MTLLYTSELNEKAGFELTTLVVMDTDCTDSCKSNYHAITTASLALMYLFICIQIVAFFHIFYFMLNYFYSMFK
jgi:hypothetical protein